LSGGGDIVSRFLQGEARAAAREEAQSGTTLATITRTSIKLGRHLLFSNRVRQRWREQQKEESK